MAQPRTIMNRRRIARLAALVFATVFLASWPLAQWPVAACAAEGGSITGAIKLDVDSKSPLKSISAVDRSAAAPSRVAGRFDRETGQFEITGLPLARAYDLLLEFANGARLEGVDLRVPASDYEEEQPLAADDVKVIREKIAATNKFEDEVQPLAIVGNIQHAAVLLNKLRTKPFYESKPGEVVWRCELWSFVRPEDTWVKDPDALFLTLYRERLQGKLHAARRLTFDPRLGGLFLSREAPSRDLGELDPPSDEPGIRIRGVEPLESEAKDAAAPAKPDDPKSSPADAAESDSPPSR